MEERLHHLIDKHFSGTLNEAEQQEYEQLLRSNPEFAEEAALQEQLVQMLSDKEQTASFDHKLEAMGDQYFKKEAKRTSLPGRYWLVAAALLVLVVAYVVIQFNRSPSATELYARYAQHPSFSMTEMSSAANDHLAKAEAAFAQPDYLAAQEALQAYLSQSADDHQARLFLGIAQLEAGKLEEAHRTFSRLQNSSPDFEHLSTWYQALTFLKQNRLPECRAALEQIPEGASKYAPAQELLKEIGG